MTDITDEQEKKSTFSYLLLKGNSAGDQGRVGTKTVAFPIGMIMMWQKPQDEIPDGWAVCHGQTYLKPNGNIHLKVPDLRGLFVVGPNYDSTKVSDISLKMPPSSDGNYTTTRRNTIWKSSHTHTATYNLVNMDKTNAFYTAEGQYDKTTVDTTNSQSDIPVIRIRPTNIALHYIIRIY